MLPKDVTQHQCFITKVKMFEKRKHWMLDASEFLKESQKSITVCDDRLCTVKGE